MADRPRSPKTGIHTRWLLLGGAAVLAVLVVAIVVVMAGGHRAPPGAHGTPAPTDSVAGGIGAPADAQEADRIVEITALDTMAFEPAAIELAAGETVTFRVTNAGQAAHEFTLGDAAMQREHAEAMSHMPGGMPHDLPNSIRLEPGETRELTWRFGAAAELEYACHEPGHYEAAMRGRIGVW
jgi:uncharacterized cupredoxin-like copper-binding protein